MNWFECFRFTWTFMPRGSHYTLCSANKHYRVQKIAISLIDTEWFLLIISQVIAFNAKAMIFHSNSFVIATRQTMAIDVSPWCMLGTVHIAYSLADYRSPATLLASVNVCVHCALFACSDSLCFACDCVHGFLSFRLWFSIYFMYKSYRVWVYFTCFPCVVLNYDITINSYDEEKNDYFLCC